MIYIKRPNIYKTNAFFLLSALVLLYLGSMVQGREIFSGLLITEYILVLLPNILFLKVQGISLKEVLRLNRIGFRNIGLIILITIFSYPLVVFINAIFLGIISIFKEVIPNTLPAPADDIQYIYSFFVMAISPGICEEIMFRGTIMSAYHRLGRKKAIIISALLFGIFHFTLFNFIGPIILGLIFGIMVYKTNSIYSSIIGHTLNNGIAVTLLYYISKHSETIEEMGTEETLGNLALGKGLVLFFLIIFIVLICGIIVIKLLNKLSPSVEVYGHDEFIDYNYESTLSSAYEYLPLLMSIFVFIYINWRFVLL